MAITDRSIGQLIESTITITTISSQEPVLIRTADRTPARVAMEHLLQEVRDLHSKLMHDQLQLQAMLRCYTLTQLHLHGSMHERPGS